MNSATLILTPMAMYASCKARWPIGIDDGPEVLIDGNDEHMQQPEGVCYEYRRPHSHRHVPPAKAKQKVSLDSKLCALCANQFGFEGGGAFSHQKGSMLRNVSKNRLGAKERGEPWPR